MRSPARSLAVLLTTLAVSMIRPVEAAPADASTPGALRVTREDRVIELPLRHTKVAIEVTAFVARATIEQVFVNPFAEPVEAVYTFPLGDRAAVDDFELVVGDRTIRGEIKRREEARAHYEQARAAGYQAALLEQERPNIFTQSVANLEPGKPITVRLRTIETLRYERGVYRLTFPLVVGPRYIAGGSVADAARIAPPVLAPNTRSGHDVEITVTIDAGVPLTKLESVSHRTVILKTSARGATVRLADDDAIPNKDFLLRWSVASERPALGLLAHRDGLDGFFTLLVQPKGDVGPAEAMSKEITFVLDTSGSMSGIPIEASKRLAARALRALGPRDTFNLIRFAGDNEVYSKDPLPNDRASIESAIAWLNRQQGRGGTELLAAIETAFARPADPNRLRVVVFLTDGFVGDDANILARIGKVIGDSRIYTVGIGTSVNHHLLDRMADLGRGAYVFVRPDESADDALEAFRSWVTLPYLTDLSIDWGALPVTDLAPERLRDLGSGQTATVVGRYLAAGEGNVVVRGKLGGRYFEQTLHVVLPEREPKNEALSSLWARGRIEELLRDGGDLTPESIKAEVIALALNYRLMSPYTSFVAVDDSRVVNPSGASRAVHQALPLPEGVSFEGIFGKEGPAAAREKSESAAEPEDKRDDASDAAMGGVVGGVAGGVPGGVVSGIAGGIEQNLVAANLPLEKARGKNPAAAIPRTVSLAPPPPPPASRVYQSELVLAEKVSYSDGDGNPNVNGARERDFRTQVGGIRNVDPLTGTFLNLATSDSIDDLTVITAGVGSVDRSGSSHRSPTAASRLLESAFRVLADLADDGKLSPAEGRPALAALLAAQRGSGAIADDVAVHSIATWALAEAAIGAPGETLVADARTKAVDYLVGLVKPNGFPARSGGAVDAEATRWARLILRAIRPAAVAAIPVPKGEPTKPYTQLRASLAAAKSGGIPPTATGRLPFARLVRSIGRGNLKVMGV